MDERTMQDLMLYATVPIKRVDHNSNADKIIGTGFFYEDFTIFLVTCRHVIDDAEDSAIAFIGHSKTDKKRRQEIEINKDLLFWKDDSLGIFFILSSFIFSDLNSLSTDLVAYPLPQGDADKLHFQYVPKITVAQPSELQEKYNVIVPVAMFGFPNGYWDEENLLCLVRTGHTASHPGLTFGHAKEGRLNITNYAVLFFFIQPCW